MDIYKKGEEVPVLVAQDGFVSAREEMAARCRGSVNEQGIALGNALQDPGKRDVFRFDQERDVIAHEHIGREAKMAALFVGGEDAELFFRVGHFHLRNLLLLHLLLLKGRDFLSQVSRSDHSRAGRRYFCLFNSYLSISESCYLLAPNGPLCPWPASFRFIARFRRSSMNTADARRTPMTEDPHD